MSLGISSHYLREEMLVRVGHKAGIITHAAPVAAGSGGDSGVCSPCSYISSPSPPHTKPKYCDPHLSYMDRVVMEIVETEGVYVNDLAQVIIVGGSPMGSPLSPVMEDLYTSLSSPHVSYQNVGGGTSIMFSSRGDTTQLP
ncbi:hypothetical protein AAG570_002095 [Ranatra chinensis]|uniref:Actin n=1 Tax=Ranatra chinensis TaxID=642074 RepID=A0ABD0YPD3_9HEMI